MKIAILGGAGAFGSWYADLFFEKGHSVIITRTKHQRNENILFVSDNKEAVKDADIVILTVPIKETIQVLKEVINLVKENSLIVDFASVKSDICKELEKYRNKKIEIASVHPMHGPRITSLKARKVVFIPIKVGEKYKWLRNFFEEEKAEIIDSTAKEHDEALSIVQGLTHFSSIVSAATINSFNLNIDYLKKFSSPNCDILIGLMSRILLQDPELYASIQIENKKNKKVRENFIKIAKLLDKEIKKGNRNKVVEIIRDSGKIFHNVERNLFESDKMIEALNSEMNYLLKQAGKKIVVKNILTKNFHYGILKSVSAKEIVLIENNRELKLTIPNIIVLREDETREWKIKNIKQEFRDYSFLIEENVDEKEALNLFNNLEGIKEINVIDVFKSQKFYPKKSITIRVSIFQDEDIEKVNEKILRKIKSLGYSIR